MNRSYTLLLTGNFVVRQKNAGIIRQDHRVRLTIGVEFERDQGSVP